MPPPVVRSPLPFVLSGIMIVIYFGFILLVAYDKPLLGTQIVPGLNWGILLGALVIVSAWGLAVVLFYLTAQMVGAGKLIQLLFGSSGLKYKYAIVIVGAVMMVYVLFGGMIATTWVQIIKAGLLLGGAVLMTLMVLSRFGGEPMLGFIAAVAFATILAVVAGLTLSGASALSHDLWVNVVRNGEAPEREQLSVARYATLFFGVAAVGLGLAFRTANAADLVGLAFAIAASANFPALILSIFWRRITTAGAVASRWTGTISAVGLIVLSPAVWKDVLNHPEPIFSLRNPGLVSIPLSFVVAVAVSLAEREPLSEEKFLEVRQRMAVGATGG